MTTDSKASTQSWPSKQKVLPCISSLMITPSSSTSWTNMLKNSKILVRWTNILFMLCNTLSFNILKKISWHSWNSMMKRGRATWHGLGVGRYKESFKVLQLSWETPPTSGKSISILRSQQGRVKPSLMTVLSTLGLGCAAKDRVPICSH